MFDSQPHEHQLETFNGFDFTPDNVLFKTNCMFLIIIVSQPLTCIVNNIL